MIESTSPKKDQESHHDHIQTLLQAQSKPKKLTNPRKKKTRAERKKG